MKDLVDRDKLDAMLDKEALRADAKTDRRGCAVLTVGHIKTLLVLCILSPADLKTLDLAALRVLDKIEQVLRRELSVYKDRKDWCGPPVRLLLENILGTLADLESAADLKEMREILEKARRWDEVPKSQQATFAQIEEWRHGAEAYRLACADNGELEGYLLTAKTQARMDMRPSGRAELDKEREETSYE